METVCVRIKRKTVAGAKNNKGKIHGSTVIIFTTQKIVLGYLLLTHTTPVHTHKIVKFDVEVEKPAAKYSQIS